MISRKFSLLLVLLSLALSVSAGEAPRIFVSTDIGGSDPDDFQSMVHLLVYADRFEIEGLISSPPHEGRVDAIFECLDAYEHDYPNLKTWSTDYPSPESLRAITKQGAIEPQSLAIPDREISEGAKLLIKQAQKKDPRPLWVLVWGSITDVAQAVRKDPSIKKHIRVYSIGSWNTKMDRQARDYLFQHHPDLWWIENDTSFRGMYIGGDQSGDMGNLTFSQNHIADHGSLGELFMEKMAKIKMGDTPSVLYFLTGNIDDPDTEHWGGQFHRIHKDTHSAYWYDLPWKEYREEGKVGARTVNQWRTDYLHDWANRMDRAQSAKSNP